MYAWTIITARHHVPGKCKQYSAAQRHNGWCVCRLYWTVDPIISWGIEREAKAPQERDKGWLTQAKSRGPSWTACASAAAKPPWDSAQQLGDAVEPSREVARSSVSLPSSVAGKESSHGEKHSQSLRLSLRHVGVLFQLKYRWFIPRQGRICHCCSGQIRFTAVRHAQQWGKKKNKRMKHTQYLVRSTAANFSS